MPPKKKPKVKKPKPTLKQKQSQVQTVTVNVASQEKPKRKRKPRAKKVAVSVAPVAPSQEQGFARYIYPTQTQQDNSLITNELKAYLKHVQNGKPVDKLQMDGKAAIAREDAAKAAEAEAEAEAAAEAEAEAAAEAKREAVEAAAEAKRASAQSKDEPAVEFTIIDPPPEPSPTSGKKSTVRGRKPRSDKGQQRGPLMRTASQEALRHGARLQSVMNPDEGRAEENPLLSSPQMTGPNF